VQRQTYVTLPVPLMLLADRQVWVNNMSRVALDNEAAGPVDDKSSTLTTWPPSHTHQTRKTAERIVCVYVDVPWLK